jgi:cytochrome c-type biogenesis protein CcmH/NrfG
MTREPQISAIPRVSPPANGSGITPSPLTTEQPPLKELLVDLWQNLEKLVRQEITLASTEMEVKAKKLKAELASSAIGAGMLLAGVLAFVAAVILLLALAMPAWLAALVTSGATCGGGYVLLKRGTPTVDDVKPERTLQNLKKDIQTFTEATK